MSYFIVNLELELLFGGKEILEILEISIKKEILEISIEKKNIYM